MTAGALAARRPLLLLALGAVGCGALALLPGEAGALATRAGLAGLAVGGVAAVAAAAQRHRPGRSPQLRVTARAQLGRAGCLAVVEVDGQRFLVGAGERSVELLAELGPSGGPERAVDGAAP